MGPKKYVQGTYTMQVERVRATYHSTCGYNELDNLVQLKVNYTASG